MKNKKILFLIIAAIILILAIITSIILFDDFFQNTPNLQSTTIANPAATFCIEHGGKYEIKTADDGSQSGICIINGQEYDEWEYFRNNQE